MPIRIYALAKELKIDSKELVDICKRAGVTGKGSALASLTDDETTKVRAYLTGSSKPAVKVGVATSETRQPESPTVFTRDDYIAPDGFTGKARTSEPSSSPLKVEKKKKENGSEAPKTPGRKDPVVKLAAIPQAQQPTPSRAVDEPAPQKPIMTLPADAIRGAKIGSSAPLEQFTKQQERKRQGEAGRTVAQPAGDDAKKEGTRSKFGTKDRRRVKGGEPKDKDEGFSDEKDKSKGLAGMASTRAARQQNRKRRTTRLSTDSDEDVSTGPRRRRTRLTRKGTNTAAPRKGRIALQLPCTVRSFSEATGVPTVQIQRYFMNMGSAVNINAELDPETAEMLAVEFGLDVAFRQPSTLEDTLLPSLERPDDEPAVLQPRPPVVTFLGHVDHGKTSLLDRIIGMDVVSGEAGGITQHIRAYQIDKDGRKIAFVDTPGHEAFTEMRARGANVTDIAVLVIAADDGVMPQTEEAISHAKAANVPIIVALNKIDLPGADANRVMQELSTHELLPSEWGGEVEVVKTSAITGEGIDNLLETLLLTAEIHEYRANADRAAVGTCLEAQQESGRGVIAKFIVQNGTLRVGDVLVCGGSHGKVKAMYDTLRARHKVREAGPSTPVNLTGLDVAPEAGQSFYVLQDVAQAREIAQARGVRSRTQSLSGRSTRISFEEFQRRREEGVLGDDQQVATLNLIIRADVRGSIEAIQKELAKLDHPEVQVRVLQATVGGITVADATLADASNAVIVGFNVIPDEAARATADQRGVEIRRYDIIYKLTEDIKLLLEGKLRPEERIADLGRALVQQIFSISRVGTVAGCRVLAGTIERGCRVRVNRDGRGIGDYALESLRREKDDTKEVREGYECGMKLSGFNDLKEGDVLEAYKVEEVARSL